MRRHHPRFMLTELPLAIVITAVLIALSPPSFAAVPPRRSPSSAKVPEFAEMLWAILRDGAGMGQDSGWFHPSESRYEWSWLAARFDRNKDGVVTADRPIEGIEAADLVRLMVGRDTGHLFPAWTPSADREPIVQASGLSSDVLRDIDPR